jgi:hypothetical protein
MTELRGEPASIKKANFGRSEIIPDDPATNRQIKKKKYEDLATNPNNINNNIYCH